MRRNCDSREFEYFPFEPKGYKLCLVNSKVKHELAGSPYNDRRNSCENVVKHIAAKHPEAKFETLRDCTWEQLEEVRAEIGEWDLVLAGQATEHKYVGVNCGIMDQFASVFGM